jgi:phosphomannomutase
VYLVTGSDKDKTIEQVGEKIWTNVKRAYQSCGNAVYEGGKLIRQLDFKLDTELQRMLFTFKASSDWRHHHGNHIEERIGLVNYSTVGRNCDQSSRNAYYDWDRLQGERKLFCKIIENTFPELEATVGGQISIDIYPKGKNKAQVLGDIKGPITFFGDKCQPGGNDFPIVERLERERNDESVIHEVKDWTDTWEKLRGFQPAY